MYIPISRRWQEITRLLLCLSRAKHYTNLCYIGFRVSISRQGLDNQYSKCLHPTPKLNAIIYICNNNTLTAFRKLGGLICSRACLSQSCTDGDLGTQRRPRLALLLKATPPEPPVSAAAAHSVPRIPAGSLLLVHLLHADAKDKYHGCIRNDMMLMMNESQWVFTKASLDTRLPSN